MATTTTIMIARQDTTTAPGLLLDCPDATSGLQLMITVKRPVAKATKAWLSSSLHKALLLKSDRRSLGWPTKRTHHGPYTIDELHTPKAPAQRQPNRFRFSLLLTWTFWIFYLVNKFQSIRRSRYDPQSRWVAWTIFLAETLLVAQEAFLALNIIIPLLISFRPYNRSRYRLRGLSVPSVDVCITCCGEPSDIILNTISSAIAQDYPADKFRVFVLDDGRSESLRDAVCALDATSQSRGGPQIFYRSRRLAPGAKSYYKSGNLQFGIAEAKKLGESEFFASLDADMIAERDWLRTMLPHMIMDPELGLVNPPQNYYNVPTGDPLAQQTGLDVFFGIYEPLNDAMGAARCMGSGFVARHDALADIGSWPLIDVGEDFLFSTRLLDAGWKTALVAEKVQTGLAPESICAHVKQKRRWVDGAMVVHKLLGFYLCPIRCHMTWQQRTVYFLQSLQEFSPVLLLTAMLLLPGAMLYQQFHPGHIRQNYESPSLKALFMLTYLMAKVNHHVLHGRIGLPRVSKLQAHDVWTAPYSAMRCLKALLPNASHIFMPSGSITSTVNERSAKLRATFYDRLFSGHLAFHGFYVVYAATPLILFLVASLWSPHSSLARLPIGPAVKLLSLMAGAAAPLWYMAFPPTVPEWQQLTTLDAAGVRRPRKKKVSKDEALDGFSAIDALQLGVLALCFVN